ncbi:hypothetical protein PFISCL1PPCAC_5197, partial [Pristionchus fissidentatus]
QLLLLLLHLLPRHLQVVFERRIRVLKIPGSMIVLSYFLLCHIDYQIQIVAQFGNVEIFLLRLFCSFAAHGFHGECFVTSVNALLGASHVDDLLSAVFGCPHADAALVRHDIIDGTVGDFDLCILPPRSLGHRRLLVVLFHFIFAAVLCRPSLRVRCRFSEFGPGRFLAVRAHSSTASANCRLHGFDDSLSLLSETLACLVAHALHHIHDDAALAVLGPVGELVRIRRRRVRVQTHSCENIAAGLLMSFGGRGGGRESGTGEVDLHLLILLLAFVLKSTIVALLDSSRNEVDGRIVIRLPTIAPLVEFALPSAILLLVTVVGPDSVSRLVLGLKMPSRVERPVQIPVLNGERLHTVLVVHFL